MAKKEISTHPLKDQRQNPSNTPSPARKKKDKERESRLKPNTLHRVTHTGGKKTKQNMPMYPYPCCVLPQVAAFVLNSIGVPKLLKELHLFNDVLPFLHTNTVG